jgi:Transglycosylase SLT domain
MKLGTLIDGVCNLHTLNREIVAGLIAVESGGVWWRRRFEPAFYDHYIRNKELGLLPGYVHLPGRDSATEKLDLATSWGLMQIMGQTAREAGFNKEMETLLFPKTNVAFGAKKLRACLEREKFDYEKALLRYNGGANAGYPTKVLDASKSRVSEIYSIEVADL